MAETQSLCRVCSAPLEGRDVYEGICTSCREEEVLGLTPAPKPKPAKPSKPSEDRRPDGAYAEKAEQLNIDMEADTREMLALREAPRKEPGGTSLQYAEIAPPGHTPPKDEGPGTGRPGLDFGEDLVISIDADTPVPGAGPVAPLPPEAQPPPEPEPPDDLVISLEEVPEAPAADPAQAPAPPEPAAQGEPPPPLRLAEARQEEQEPAEVDVSPRPGAQRIDRGIAARLGEEAREAGAAPELDLADRAPSAPAPPPELHEPELTLQVEPEPELQRRFDDLARRLDLLERDLLARQRPLAFGLRAAVGLALGLGAVALALAGLTALVGLTVYRPALTFLRGLFGIQ